MTERTAVPRRSLKVFISSTSLDLDEYRGAVARVLNKRGHATIQMETFLPKSGTPLSECIKLVRGSDAMVLLIADRYGWVPSVAEGGDGEKSITWLEFEAAVFQGLPVYAFLSKHPEPHVADNAAGLQRFRTLVSTTHLRSTFASPPELAEDLSGLLGELVAQYEREFGKGLRLIELGAFSAASFAPSRSAQAGAIARALQPSISIQEWDDLLGGSNTIIAQQALRDAVKAATARTSALRGELGRAESAEYAARTALQSVINERPPSPPYKPSLSTHPLQTDEERARATVVFDREYERYRHNLRAYEVAVTAHNERQARIPHDKREVERLHLDAINLGERVSSALMAAQQEQRALALEVDRARDRDIVLAVRRSLEAAQGRMIGDVTNAFLLLLGTECLRSALRKHVSNLTSAGQDLDQIGHQLAEAATDAVTRQFPVIGSHSLAAVAQLAAALEHGRAAIRDIGVTLDVIAQEQISASAARAKCLLETQLPNLPEYETITDPTLHPQILARVEAGLKELRQAAADAREFMERSRPVRETVVRADAQARDVLTSFRKTAASYQPVWNECELGWKLLSRAGSFGSTSDVARFSEALTAEASSRFGAPVSAIIERCARTEFGLTEAVAAHSGHGVTALLRQFEALEQLIGKVDRQITTFEQAAPSIRKLAADQAKAFRHSVGAETIHFLLPLLNVGASIRVSRACRRHQAALASHHPDWRGLAGWTLRRTALGALASVAWLIASGVSFARVEVEEVQLIVALIGVSCFFAAVIGASNLLRLTKLMRA